MIGSSRHPLPVSVAAFLFALWISGPSTAHAASLSGRIAAAESIAVPEPISVWVDKAVCAPDGGKVADPRLTVSEDRGLADVVVIVHGAAPADASGVGEPVESNGELEARAGEKGEADPEAETPAASEVVIDQKACVFLPHVTVASPGQDVRVKNSDTILHTFRTITGKNRKLNKAQVAGKEDVVEFAEPEIIPISCDVHHWMSAVIVVAPHEWVAVTDAAGEFSIDGLAPGDYTLELWHETLGAKKAAVSVAEDGGRFDLVWEPERPEAGATLP